MFFESVGILRHFINFNLCPASRGDFLCFLRIKKAFSCGRRGTAPAVDEELLED